MPATGRRRIRWGRVLPVLALLLICAGYTGWQILMKRSATIRLELAGYDLTYTVAWGMGMEQKLSFSKIGSLSHEASSEWIEIWKRSYNSGLSVYREKAGGRYYLGTLYKRFIFDPISGELSAHCDPDRRPLLTDLGNQLDFYRSWEAHETLDPGGKTLFRYVEANQATGPVPDIPPESRYFADLEYLGRFGLVRSDGRGNEIRFVPAGNSPEPRNSLLAHCG